MIDALCLNGVTMHIVILRLVWGTNLKEFARRTDAGRPPVLQRYINVAEFAPNVRVAVSFSRRKRRIVSYPRDLITYSR